MLIYFYWDFILLRYEIRVIEEMRCFMIEIKVEGVVDTLELEYSIRCYSC